MSCLITFGPYQKFGKTLHIDFSGGRRRKLDQDPPVSSGASKLSVEYLEKIAEEPRNKKRRGGTDQTYYEAWLSFNEFLIRLDSRPDCWDDRICLFVAHLIVSGHPPPTIATYASGGKGILKDDSVQIDDNSVALASLLKGCRNNYQHEKRR